MKKRLFLFILPFFLLANEECEAPEAVKKSIWDYHPIHVGGNGIAIGRANVTPRHKHQRGELTFNKANAYIYTFVPAGKCNFFLPRVEWNTFTLDWNKNPKFSETHFQYIQFALTFLSIGVEKWRWIVRGEYNSDVNDFGSQKTALYSAILWGTYELNDNWHYHIGGLGYTGFRGSQIYPIIGLDYTHNKKWFFQVVFPITYSIDYILNKEWRISLKGRPLKERFRSGASGSQPYSIFSYSSMGAEFNVHYEKFLNLEIELFAGYNFGGNFYIKDQEGHNALYTDVSGAPYVGASLNWGI